MTFLLPLTNICMMLNYESFINIYVIAVGISMAYVFVSKDRTQTFFRFLGNMSEWFANAVLRMRLKPKEMDSQLKAQIEYYLSLPDLEITLKTKLEVLYRDINKFLTNINVVESQLQTNLNSSTKVKYLNVISFDTFLYGLFIILLIGFYRCKVTTYTNEMVFILSSLILLFNFHCIICDHIATTKSFFVPRIISHVILWLVVLIACYLKFSPNQVEFFDNLQNHLVCSSLILCFSGFITYFVVSSIFCIFYTLKTCWTFFRAPMKQYSKDHLEKLKELQPDFEKLKQQIENLPEMKISAQTSTTD